MIADGQPREGLEPRSDSGARRSELYVSDRYRPSVVDLRAAPKWRAQAAVPRTRTAGWWSQNVLEGLRMPRLELPECEEQEGGEYRAEKGANQEW